MIPNFVCKEYKNCIIVTFLLLFFVAFALIMMNVTIASQAMFERDAEANAAWLKRCGYLDFEDRASDWVTGYIVVQKEDCFSIIIDVNECAEDYEHCGWNGCEKRHGICANNASCENTKGSYICTCNVGYTGDGKDVCTDDNECISVENYCDLNRAKCLNSEGSYHCQCETGYTGNGKVCQDIDECNSPMIFDSSTICKNTWGSYECTCKSGYELTGHCNCTNIDECAGSGHDKSSVCTENSTCIDTEGDYICKCNDGFIGNGKVTCQSTSLLTKTCVGKNNSCRYHYASKRGEETDRHQAVYICEHLLPGIGGELASVKTQEEVDHLEALILNDTDRKTKYFDKSVHINLAYVYNGTDFRNRTVYAPVLYTNTSIYIENPLPPFNENPREYQSGCIGSFFSSYNYRVEGRRISCEEKLEFICSVERNE